MPLSVRKKFIFVHIPKNAGSTLTLLWHDHFQLNGRNSKWRRFTSNFPIKEDENKLCVRGHDSAAWLKVKLGSDKFDEFYKFAFSRNPYSRAISAYEYLRQREEHKRNKRVTNLEFEEFISDRAFRYSTQEKMVCDRDGRILVDDIFKVEQFDNLIGPLCKKLKITKPKTIQPANTSKRKPLEEYLSPKAVRIIQDTFAKDFEIFEYSKSIDALI